MHDIGVIAVHNVRTRQETAVLIITRARLLTVESWYLENPPPLFLPQIIHAPLILTPPLSQCSVLRRHTTTHAVCNSMHNALTNADEGHSLLLHNHEGGVDVLNLLHTQSWVLVGPGGRGRGEEGRSGGVRRDRDNVGSL